jgi:hypothetical protein
LKYSNIRYRPECIHLTGGEFWCMVYLWCLLICLPEHRYLTSPILEILYPQSGVPTSTRGHELPIEVVSRVQEDNESGIPGIGRALNWTGSRAT